MTKRTLGWTFVRAACMLAVLAPGMAAQDTGWPAMRSTVDGVYTDAQAARGQESYGYMCQSCHTAGTHDGPAFLNAWSGRSLWELFQFIKYSMPKGDPGVLTPEETAQFLAYLLKMNGLPAGSEELPADSVILKAIRFDTKKR